MKNLILKILAALVITGLAAWLFFYDKAAQPGNLSGTHADITDCNTCHIPWQGVKDYMCLQCHEFGDVSALDPRLRFHEAEKYCLKCHREHLGPDANISKVDHTIFHGGLLCTQCHLDRHQGLFGSNCRECHGITSMKIEGFRHPAENRTDCNRCHKGPAFHYDERVWEIILKGMGMTSVNQEDCWQCHITLHWPHLKQKMIWPRAQEP